MPKVQQKEIDNTKGIVGLSLGIASIIFWWLPIIGIASAIIGLVFSIKQRKENPNGVATAGFVMSIIGLVLGVIYILFLIFIIIAVISLSPVAVS